MLTSESELRKIGVLVERLQLDTPMASVEIGTLIDRAKAPHQYDHAECIVLSQAVPPDQLPQIDSGATDSVTKVRQSESTKDRSVFLVLGKEISRTYLAFQFVVHEQDGTEMIRYLLQIDKIARGEG